MAASPLAASILASARAVGERRSATKPLSCSYQSLDMCAICQSLGECLAQIFRRAYSTMPLEHRGFNAGGAGSSNLTWRARPDSGVAALRGAPRRVVFPACGEGNSTGQGIRGRWARSARARAVLAEKCAQFSAASNAPGFGPIGARGAAPHILVALAMTGRSGIQPGGVRGSSRAVAEQKK